MTDQATPGAAAATLGARLRAGREARGLTAADAAAKLRISLAIVESIEGNDLERLGAVVYARGYLASYARLVDLPITVVDSALRRIVEPLPVLRSTTHVSHGRFLLDRYTRRAASIVLTASIVVPVVWLATEERLPVQPLALRSLDSAASTPDTTAAQALPGSQSAEMVGPPAGLAGAAEPSTRMDPQHDVPVVASFAPFLGARQAAADVETSSGGWRLVFRGDSWVEILDRNGQRLDFGVIRGGSERRYPAGSVASVALGNAGVVDVIRDGEPLLIAPFQRANVARFAVSSSGELTPAGG